MSVRGMAGFGKSARQMALAGLLSVFSGCVPWTVRPIDEARDSKPAGQAALSPAAYVDSIWSSSLVPAILNSAVDARALLDALSSSFEQAGNRYGRREANGPRYFLVKGQGRVLSVDTRSRAGSLLLDVAPLDGQADISLQIGPVLRGTSLRDAPGVVHFTDFINQLQFADVGNELNDRVLKTVIAPIETAKLGGRMVSFVGTASCEDGARPPIRELVPVRLEVEGRP
jgi:predicted lipoprotein